MESTIDAVFPAGRFDKFLMLTDGNRQMYDFMGAYVYCSLHKMIRQEDVKRLEDAVRRCVEPGVGCVDECVHVINAQGEYERFLVSVEDCGDSEHYRIEFQNVSDGERKLVRVNEKCAVLQDYLTVSGKVLFTYKPVTDEFRMFWMDYGQVIEVYNQPLEEWMAEVVQKKMVEGRDKDIFELFCAAMRQEEQIQNFSFHGSILTRGGTQDAYKIKFLPRIYGGEKTVIGTWSVINEQTGNDVDDFVEGTQVDGMTKILNKRAITDYAEASVKAGGQVSIVMLDVDNFKTVNDTYGHLFGDKVITAVAEVMKKTIGENGAAGRVGGDEFMAVIKDFGDEAGLRNYLRTIKTNVASLFQDKLGVNRVSCSIGASRSGIDSGQYKELVRIADKALYIAKQKGKNRFIIYMEEKHGQFHMSEDGYDMMEIRDSFYSEKDLKRFNDLLAETVLKGSSSMQALLDHAVSVLTIDRLIVLWGKDLALTALSPKGRPGTEGERTLLEYEGYLDMFQEDMLTITNTNMLEFNLPEVYAVFHDNGVKSVIQHLLRDEDGKLAGIILAEECVNLKHFPKLPTQLFESMCKVANAVLIKESRAAADGSGRGNI